MKNNKTLKLTLSALLCAVAVVGSTFSFPVFGSKCSPIQHMVNVLCAVLLSPAYGTGAAFGAALIRNLSGLGSVLAFPGSMLGAALSGMVYKKTGSIWAAVAGEVFGTAVLGGLCAYPLAVALLGVKDVAFYAYIVPFLVSTAVGSLVSGILIHVLDKTGNLQKMKEKL